MKGNFFKGKPRALALFTAVILLVSGLSFAGASGQSTGLTGVRLLDSGGADLAGQTVEADAAIVLEYAYENARNFDSGSGGPAPYSEEISLEVPPEIDLTGAVFHGAAGKITGMHRAAVKVPTDEGVFQVQAGFNCGKAAQGGRHDLIFPLTERDETIPIEIVPAAALYAATPIDKFDRLVTGIQIYEGDPENGGRLLGGSGQAPTISQNTTLYIKYQFAVQAGQITPDQPYEVTCPEGLLWNGSSSEKALHGKVRNEKGETVTVQYGTLHIQTGSTPKKVTVGFKSDFNENSDGKFGGTLDDGYLYVYSGPDPDQADENGKLDIKWDGATVLSLYVDEKVPKAGKLEKKGEMSGGQFLWTINYHAGNKDPVPDAITDQFDATNQSYVPGSFTVNGSGASDPQWESDGVYQKMVYPLTNPGTDDVAITYKTTPTDHAFQTADDVTVSNEAWLSKAGVEQPGSKDAGSATLGKNQKTWVKKSGAYNAAQKCIHWTVTINTFGRNISDLKMIDELPKGALLPSEVKVDSYSPISPINSSGTGQNGGSKFEISIPQNAGGKYDDVYTLSYDTKIEPSYYDGSKPDQNFPNDVTLSFRWYPLEGGQEYPSISPGAGASPYVTTNMIQKTGSYNRSTHQITWKILVNPYGVDLSGYTVTVDDPLVKQRYVGPAGAYPAGVSCNADDPAHPVFTVTGMGNGNVEFGFITELTDLADYAYNNPGSGFNKEYTNTAHMKAVGTGDPIESDAVGRVDVVSQVVSKTGKSYDCGKQEIAWEVIVNQNKMPMEDAVLKDALPAGLSYVENSLQIDGVGASPDQTSPLQISLGDFSNEKKVSFSTMVDTDQFPAFKDSSQVSISNDITLSRKDRHDVTEKGACTIHNKALEKEGVYKNEADGASIAYTVKLNPQALTFLGSEVLTDTLPLGLELDIQSVKLCKASVDAAGTNFTPGEPVKLVKGANFSYHDDGSEFSILMPPGKSPYLLTYTADLNGKASGPFTNKIKFGGFSGNIGSSSAAGIGGGGGGGGVSYKKKGTIKIVKTDQYGNPVSGAAFMLGQDAQTTGSDGTAIFARVAAGTYDLTETPRPGYVLDPEEAEKLKGVEVKMDQVTEVSIVNRKLPSASTDSPAGGGTGGGGASSGGGSSGDGGGMLTPPSPLGKVPESGGAQALPEGETVSETTPPNTPKTGKIAAPADSRFVLAAPPGAGTVVVNSDGSWDYIPVQGFRGTDSFVVEVHEPGGIKRTVNVLVTIEDPPVPKGPPNTGGGITQKAALAKL